MLSRIVTTPSQCPVDIAALRRQARVDHNYDDDLLLTYGQSATELAEEYTGRVFLTKSVTWTIAQDEEPTSRPVVLMQRYQRDWLHLPHSATSVEAVRIGTTGGEIYALTPGDDYYVDLATEPARIRFRVGDPYWFTTDHITVQYTTGYGPTSADVPAKIKLAILALVTGMNEHRGDTKDVAWCRAVEDLLGGHRMRIRVAAPTDVRSA